MGLKCLVVGHNTTSGESKIEVTDLWQNTCVYWCKECEDIVVSLGESSDRDVRKAVSAAEGVLDAPDEQYDEMTRRAARKVVEAAE